jgi:sugar/nucleoside kinase (ribokinase family)
MVIGDCVIDYYPDFGKKLIGGSGLNTAVYLKQKGISTDIMGIVGNDKNGKKILNYLKKNNFDLANINEKDGKTGIAYIEKEEKDYQIKKVEEGVKKNYKFDKNEIKSIKNYKFIHTNIYTHTLEYLPLLKENNDMVSFDYSFKIDLEKLKFYEDHIDVLFVNKKNVTRAFVSTLKTFDIDYIVITSGEKGFTLIRGEQDFFKESFGDDIIDSTGAGDTLIGEFLAGLHNNSDLETIMNSAAEHSYKTCLKLGAAHAD